MYEKKYFGALTSFCLSHVGPHLTNEEQRKAGWWGISYFATHSILAYEVTYSYSDTEGKWYRGQVTKKAFTTFYCPHTVSGWQG